MCTHRKVTNFESKICYPKKLENFEFCFVGLKEFSLANISKNTSFKNLLMVSTMLLSGGGWTGSTATSFSISLQKTMLYYNAVQVDKKSISVGLLCI